MALNPIVFTEKVVRSFLRYQLPTYPIVGYGLSHDERAQQHQPVAGRLGPRFYDWQLTQTPEEPWREGRLHARNLLGEAGYRQLLDEIEESEPAQIPEAQNEPRDDRPTQRRLFG